MKKKLALIHTVHWYDQSVFNPFAKPWLKENPDVEIVNIMDDSLLSEPLPNGGPTEAVIRRMVHYFLAAEVTGADVIMSTCTTMGPATRVARQMIKVPVFNIDEPMANEAVVKGKKLGILATVPTSAPATHTLLNIEAAAVQKDIHVKTVINEAAFRHLLTGNVTKHDKLIHGELDKLQEQVDVIVLSQVSLAQIKYQTNVPMLQVGHSGFAEAKRLLNV